MCSATHHPALARRARVRRRSTQVRQPSACRLLIPAPSPIRAPPRPIPTHLFHVKHRRIIPGNRERESPTAPGLTLSLRSLVSARCARCAAGAQEDEFLSTTRASEPFLPYSRVSRETSEHRPPVPLSCPRSERSSPVLSLSLCPTTPPTSDPE